MTQEEYIFIIIFIIVCVILYRICSYGMNSSPSNAVQLLDIIYLKKSTCPYCIKMDQVLRSNNLTNFVTVVESNSDIAKKLMKAYNVNGFPCFISKKTNKVKMGYTESVSDLIASLS